MSDSGAASGVVGLHEAGLGGRIRASSNRAGKLAINFFYCYGTAMCISESHDFLMGAANMEFASRDRAKNQRALCASICLLHD